MTDLRIVQISDTHLAPGFDAVERNFDAAAAWIRAQKPDLVVHTGDVTRDAPGAPEELRHAALRLADLGAPLLTIPGNHDVGDNPAEGHLPASPVGEGPLAAWREVFGADRFAQEIGGWRIVGLNAQLLSSGLPQEAEQEAWLDAALSGHPRIALFIHKPLFLDDPETPADVVYRYVPMAPRRRIMERIARGAVKLVGCGHVHQTRSLTRDGVLYGWAPATAFFLPDAVQPRVGTKLCGLLDWRLSADGRATCTLVQPQGMADQDLETLPRMYG